MMVLGLGLLLKDIIFLQVEAIQKPYDMSDKEYNTEMYKRSLQNNEDTPDSLKYTTKKGRIVFGGGGVTQTL